MRRKPTRGSPLWVLFLVLPGATSSSVVRDMYTKHCPPTNQTSVVSANTPPLYSQPDGLGFDLASLMEIVNKGNLSPIIKQVGAPIIICGILAVVSLITVLASFIFCCACDRAANVHAPTSKALSVVGVFLAVLLVGLAGALTYFSLEMNGRTSPVVCSLLRISMDFTYGANYGSGGFIGFLNMRYVLGNVSLSLPNVAAAKANFNNINNMNLQRSTDAAMTSLSNFYTRFANAPAADGAGGTESPKTIADLTSVINSWIGTEFGTYAAAAAQGTRACQIGLALAADTSDTLTMQSTVASVGTTLAKYASIMTDTIANAITVISTVLANSPYVFWFITASSGICAVIFVAVNVKIIKNLSAGEEGGRRFLKFFLALGAILCLIMAIMLLLLWIASIAMTGVCQALPNLLSLTSGNATSSLAAVGLNTTTDLGRIVATCLPSGTQGSILNLLSGSSSSPAVGQLLTYINGLSLLGSVLKNITNEQMESSALNLTASRWEQIRTSTLPDSSTAVTALNSLNTKVSCGNLQFRFNSNSCTTSGCKGVYQSTDPTIPSCAGSSASTGFTNLKAYTTTMDTLMTSMIDSLNSPNSNTPNTLQQNYRRAFSMARSDYDSIAAQAGTFIPAATVYTGGFAYNTNCSILRTELISFQTATCTGYSSSLFSLSIISLVVVIMLLISFWLSCCALRYFGPSIERVKPISMERVEQDSFNMKEMETVIY